MDIKQIQSGLFTDGGQQTQTNKKDGLGQEDFLRLLVTQMSYQDPMDPQDPGEFLGQLAQFGAVDGISKLNDSFGSMNQQLQSNQALHASAMVGRSVHLQSDVGVMTENKGLQGALQLDGPASNVKVFFKNQQGEVVKQLDLGNKNEGMVDFAWNGNDQNGNLAQMGAYSMSAEATVNGQSVALPTLAVSNVDSVTIGKNGQGIALNLNGYGTVKMSDVVKIT